MVKRTGMIAHAYHGWACDATVWDPLANAIDNDVSLHRYGRGYFGAERAVPTAEKPDVIITHSMGLLYVPDADWASADRIIVLNGFFHFPSSDPDVRRRTLSLLARMKANLAVDPIAQVQAFRSTAKMQVSPFNTHKLNVERLMADLDMLASHSLTVESVQARTSVCFVHATNDPIVSTSTIRDTLGAFPSADHRYIDSHSHNLPETEVDLISTLIFGS